MPENEKLTIIAVFCQSVNFLAFGIALVFLQPVKTL
jgi:hypothetical protein